MSDTHPDLARRRRVLRQALRVPATRLAFGFLVLLAVSAVFAPLLAPYDPQDQDIARSLEGPGADHLLGTNHLGQDTLSRLIFGSRVALQASLQSVGLALLVGVPLGLVVAYRSGWWDRIAMRLLDVVDSIPGLVLAFAVIAVLGPGLTNAMLAVGLIFAVSYLRLTRALVLSEREQLYVDAAQVSGLSEANILFRQVLPNISGPLIVQTTIYMGAALLVEAALSFLGLGLDITEASWGGMLNAATAWQARQQFLPWPPGAAITLTVLAFNVLGDGLRDALSAERSLSGRGRRRRQRGRERRSSPDRIPVVAERPIVTASSGSVVPALSVQHLVVRLPVDTGEPVTLVDDVSLDVWPGECVGLVGESGAGKTITGLAAMSLLPTPTFVAGGSIRIRGREVVGLNERQLTSVRGRDIGMVFQDPLVALSPVHTIGRHLAEAVRRHDASLSRAATRRRAIELLDAVGVANPGRRLGDYPHQFSGGMAQRVVVALALAGEPRVLVADEPTTALDVTTQRQVLDLLCDLKDRMGMGVLLITHDFGVIADTCDRAAVMYAGQIVEHGTLEDLFVHPRHPYTSALLAALPATAEGERRLVTIEGRVPPPTAYPPGCRFAPRCPHVMPRCADAIDAVELGHLHDVRCVRSAELSLAGIGGER